MNSMIKKILLIDCINLGNPIEEPNPALDGSSGHQKPCPDSSFGAGWFGAKTMSCKATRRMSCSFGWPQI